MGADSSSFETVWPDESFSQFGGHVLEHLYQTKAEMARLGKRRFRVRVTIEIYPLDPLASEQSDADERGVNEN